MQVHDDMKRGLVSDDYGSSSQTAGVELLECGFQLFEAQPVEDPHAKIQIVGSDFSQVLELQIEPQTVVMAEPGTMLHMSAGMRLDADVGDCKQACTRCCCAGESLVRLHLKNESNTVQKIGLTPVYPAKIVPIDLSVLSGLYVNSGAFMAAMGSDWRFDIKRVETMGQCCCAGQGLFLKSLHGSGMAFLNAGGTVMTKDLAPGEEIIADNQSVLAFERSVAMDIRSTGGCMVCCCAGQGLYNTVLRGPGRVWIHSMGLSKLRRAMGPHGGNNQEGGGSS